MKSDEAYIVPNQNQSSIVPSTSTNNLVANAKLPFTANKKPEMLKPAVDTSNVNNATIVDNSVKSNIQNNTTNSGGLNGVRDSELEVFNRMMLNASA
jgi:hypothetical protein